MTDDEEGIARQMRQQILAWSVKHAPNLKTAQAALDRTGASQPVDDVLGSHPDLLTWTSEVRVGPRFPMSEAEFHTKLHADAGRLIDELMTFKEVQHSFEGASWYDATSLVSAAVASQPADGLVVMGQPDLDPALLSAVLNGLQRAELGVDLIEQIVELISGLELAPVVDDVARLLTDGNNGGTKVSEWHRSESARRLALRVWELSTVDIPDPSSDRWLDRAINTTAGRIALYWVRVVSADWSSTQDEWSGLSTDTRAAFDELLGESTLQSAMAEVIIASQIHLLFRADQFFAEDNVLPLLQWQDRARAVRAWDGFLMWGRWEDALLDAGLFEAYEGAIDAWESLPEHMEDALCTHLAAISIYSARDPLTWLTHFISEVPGRGRIEWSRQIGRVLSQLSGETVEKEWNRWMRRYWAQRLASVPRGLELGETSEMATWIPYLSNSVEDAVGLAVRGPVEIGEHSELLRLLDDDRFDRAPEAFIRLIVHALRDTGAPTFGGYYLKGIVERARRFVAADALAPLVEQAMALGYSDAPTWLLPRP